jgi:hypothetical protein
LIAAPTLSTIDADGQVARVTKTSDDIPSSSILARANAFDLNLSVFGAKEVAAAGALQPDASDYSQRKALLDYSTTLSNQSKDVFFGGDLPQGETILKLANIVLEGVTRLTPGISLARDIYEAVSGKDLITGADLSTLDRAAAVLGVVTVGFSEDVLGGARIISKIAGMGESAERAEKIVEAARSVDHMAVEFSEHALERMAERNIPRDHIEDALDVGSRFWDREEKSLMVFETDVAAGAPRASASIDIDKMSVKNAFWETRSDAALSKVPLDDGRPRFISIPQE